MGWERQYEASKTPEALYANKQGLIAGSWEERCAAITSEQIQAKMKVLSDKEMNALRAINPEDEKALTSFAEKIGDDEFILAGVARYLQEEQPTTH